MHARVDLGSQLLQLVAQVERRLVTAIGVLGQAALDDTAGVTGQRRPQLGDRRRLVLQDRADGGHRRVALKRPRARGHLVQDRAHREDVRARIHLLAFGLLGRHVGHCSQHAALDGVGRHRRGMSQPSLAARVAFGEGNQLCQAEVQHAQPPLAIDHDVVRLEVAVGDPGAVRAGHGVGQWRRDFEQPAQRETVLRQQLGHGPARDQLHGDEVHRASRGGRLFRRVQGHDVGMVQRRDGPRLAFETGSPVGIGRHRLGEYLQRNVATELRVLGLPDNTHPAFADLFDQAVVKQLLSGLDRHFYTPSRRGYADHTRSRALTEGIRVASCLGVRAISRY